MALEFEWDAAKADANFAKHGVSFGEASTVFQDSRSVTVSDLRHSRSEERFAILGRSADGRLLAVFHTDVDGESGLLVLVQPPAASGPPMKKNSGKSGTAKRPTAVRESAVDADEILPEYDFRGGVRGKYAKRYTEGTNVVLLDPDVAAAFPDAAAVNAALRALAEIALRQAKGRVPA
jgi:uncharacterized DUF497 family protein